MVLIVFFYLSILMLFQEIKKSKIIEIAMLLPFLYLIVVVKKIPDYDMYLNSFNNINDFISFYHRNLENGYLYITLIFRKIGFEYHYFRIVLLFFIFFLYYKVMQNMVKKNIAIFIFYCVSFIYGVLVQYRSGLMLALFLNFGIKLLENKKYKKYIILIFLLTLIHSSALLFLPLVFIYKIKTKKVKIIILILTVFLPVYFDSVIIIIDYMSNYIRALKKIFNYLNSSYWYKENSTIGLRDLFNIGVYIYFLIFFKIKNKKDNIYMWLLYLSIFWRFLFIRIPEVGLRSYLLFQFSLVYLVSSIFKSLNLKTRILYLIFLIIISYIYFYLLISQYGHGEILKI